LFKLKKYIFSSILHTNAIQDCLNKVHQSFAGKGAITHHLQIEQQTLITKRIIK